MCGKEGNGRGALVVISWIVYVIEFIGLLVKLWCYYIRSFLYLYYLKTGIYNTELSNDMDKK